MKIFKHIIKGIVWTVTSLYLLIATLFHIPNIQSRIGVETAHILSQMFGTEVHIGRIDMGFLNRIIIDDVTIYDRANKQMFAAARLAVKIDVLPLLEKKISISSAQLFGMHLNLYKTDKNTPANYQFILDSLSNTDDNTDKSPIDLRINTFIMQHSSICYDRHDVIPSSSSLNLSHLNISNLSAHISLKALTADTLNVIVKKFSLKEHSGITLDKLAFKAEANRSHIRLHDFNMKMPASEIAIDDIQASYNMSDNAITEGSLRFSGNIHSQNITPADFAALMPPLKGWCEPIRCSLGFSGSDKHINISHFIVTSATEDITINANGFYDNRGTTPTWATNIEELSISPYIIELAYQCIDEYKHPIPKVLSSTGSLTINGNAKCDGSDIIAKCNILSIPIGSVSVNCKMSSDRIFEGIMHVADVKLNTLLDNDKLGNMSADVSFNGAIPSKEMFSVNADAQIKNFYYNGYSYKDIRLNSTYRNNNITGQLQIIDPHVSLNMEGNYDLSQNEKKNLSIKAMLNNFSPSATKLTDKWDDACFQANIEANFKASNINDAEGYISLNNFSMSSDTGKYSIDNIIIKSGYEEKGTHYLSLSGDIGSALLYGNIDYTTLSGSVIDAIRKKLPTVPGLKAFSSSFANRFTLQAEINNSDWLEKIFHIPFKLNTTMKLNGQIDDTHDNLELNCIIPEFVYENTKYEDCALDISSQEDTLHSSLSLTKVTSKGNRPELKVNAKAANNNLLTTIIWDNKAEKRACGIFNTKTRFHNDEIDNAASADIEIEPSEMILGNTTWDILPARITYKKNNIEVNKFAIKHGEQHIIIDGKASDNASDSLIIDINDLDIEYVLELVNFHAVEFGGKATGRTFILAPFGDFSAYAELNVKDFTFENGHMGVLYASVDWDKTEKQININALANDGPEAQTLINGYVSPSRNFIDLGIKAQGTYIDFMHSFAGSFLRDINGQALGMVVLAGPLDNINLTGELVVNGEATMKPTNCKYFMQNDTVRFIPDDIILPNVPITDIYGHKGTLRGGIHHKHLTNLSYDLYVDANNLLAFNTHDFGEDSFYGTVFGTGNVAIHGRSGELQINIDITPQKNSIFTYNASNPDAISNQEFITWYDVTPPDTTHSSYDKTKGSKELVQTDSHAPATRTTDTRIDFRINCTPDATLKILMDNRTNDYITLTGNGTLRASYYNKGGFGMFGTYIVDGGNYGITIQDIIKKNFTFANGGTIVFGGDPYDASLNLQAIHTVNGVSLSDLNIGNSFSGNTTRVNCLMNISGSPKTPVVDFDIDLPTVSSDEKQMIRSIINGEDEMNQQVVYLLGIGRFYPQETNNASTQTDRQQSNTSLAMQSLLSGTISGQINSVLNTVINSKNWNFGANISTGDEGWNNAEYEGLLSGRMLNNRLLFNGQFGYRDNVTGASTGFIGDFDIKYLLLPNGNIAINIYNKTNDRYFTKSSLNTQGLGIIMKKDFNAFSDLFNLNKKKR